MRSGFYQNGVRFLKKVVLIIETIRHLKFIQIFYQVKFRLIPQNPLVSYFPKHPITDIRRLDFICNPPAPKTWLSRLKFSHLNLEKEFSGQVDWRFSEFGKLWNYNLQYASYLFQPDMSDETKAGLMKSQYEWLLDGRLQPEPYPVSLRTINMMRWMTLSKIGDTDLLGYLYAELDFLSKRLEYHLLGNHLLENAFALFMGGAFFHHQPWVSAAQKLLKDELDEQILKDGAHFELSPMYHQIIFFRLLELIDWYSTWVGKELALENYLRQKASDMRAWLENISFSNGDIPLFSDSANGVAYPTNWLLEYADRLGVNSSKIRLGLSGYRSIALGEYELKIDFAQIGPSYQPGHAHADALSFIMYHKGNPLFVEQGTSTYQIGVRRDLERSTQAHNTVVVNNTNQSQVWGGFRVAKRAKTTITKDTDDGIYEAKHDGYKQFGVVHTRSFTLENSRIVIVDKLSRAAGAICYLHLHPGLSIHSVRNDTVLLIKGVKIVFKGANQVMVEEYNYADSYHVYQPAKRIVIAFKQHLTSSIYFGE